MKIIRRIFPVIAFWMIMSASAFAVRYYVKPTGSDSNSGDSWGAALKTIVKATQTAQSGDVVWVAEGTYAESKTVVNPLNVALYGGFAGTESQLSERNISAHPAIIDGDNARQCIQNFGVLDGFHITKGKNEGNPGGGFFNGSLGTVANCAVYNNSTLQSGGGFYNNGTVTNCTVYNNTANYGGGINNNFSGKVTDCTVYGNSVSDLAGGIYSRGTVTNCTVYGNNAKNRGGGIYNYGTVTNCTVFNNTASRSGGGIYNDSSTVINCIVWGNNTDIKVISGEVKYSCFSDGTTGEGNIAVDPMFVNVSGDDPTKWDLRLQPNSPCIDAGTSEGAPDYDILGVKRPKGAGFDMGAYEHVKPTRYYVMPTGSDSNTGISWASAFKTIVKATQIAQTDDEIWVAEGTYAESKTVINPAGVALYGGFAGTESQLSERNISAHPTIINGEKARQCIQNLGVLDGFHITKGKNENSGGGGINNYSKVTNCTVYNNSAYYGGGINNNSSGTVTDCTVYGNSASDIAGGIRNHGAVTNCTIYNNTTLRDGGGILDTGTVTSCTVYNNNASRNGGGIYNHSGTETDCIVYKNSAEYGGGIYNRSTVTNCTVYENNSGDDGGGIYNYKGTVTSCTIYGNSAIDSGSGIYNDEESAATNCVIYSNKAEYYGGGIYNYGTATNCTVYNNIGMDGGGIFNKGTVTNCIAWGNDTDIKLFSGEVKYSCFSGGTTGEGNIAVDPMFVNVSGDDPTKWDLQLQPSSPCIDAGTSEGAPKYDILDVRRPQGEKVDMGAYEYAPPTITIPQIASHILDKKTFTSTQKKAADDNKDNIIDVADIVHILKK
ncbi:MAG TPA: choice-of-anchor Q domain-containing protein [Candidatus Sumerlaeota bacterium]|nr:choice-of-anchor Q domain-containing protein [Candidatus Sumerlaeota bacterium]HOR63972.1 choice-of-anchor Q domain-containing protein [Candidatus Sumerlaeota bacterium]